MKRTIRLTESELKQMIFKSVRRVLKEGKYDLEYQEYNNRHGGENTYLQVAMLGSPESYERYGGTDVVTDDYIKLYNTLKSTQPEKVLNLWRECAYQSNVARNMSEDDKFIVEEDSDGVYLMVRIDNEREIKKYQSGNW